MSGYWDAVNRAALGLPGTADPRPRSRFESEDGFAETLEIDAVDREIAPSTSPAAQPGATIAQPIAAGQPAPGSPAEQPGASEPPAQPTAASPPAAPRDREALAPEPKTVQEAVSEASGNRSTEAPAAAVEIHRTETTRTIVESIETPALPVIHEATPPRPNTAEPIPSPTVVARPLAAAQEPGAAEIVMATPLALPPEPGPPSSLEPAPLIIDIGRIDIRIASEAAAIPTPFRRRETGPVPSLDAYLARRSEAAR